MTRRLIVDPLAPEPERILEIVAALRAGEVVAYPTDTLYGLAVDPRQAAAVERLFELKGRATGAAMPVIACDGDQVEAQAGRLSDLDRRLGDRFWPGPLSLVIDAWPSLAPGVAASDATVAIRVPDHAIARAIARAFGHPVTATSANRSGERPAATADQAINALGAAVALVADGGSTAGGAPSTIVRVREGLVVLVREGAIPWSRVLESLQ
jgi:L-threonylcarbamoyladenylate synthase